MRKLINLRLPVLYAGMLAVGVVFAAALAFFGLNGVYILIPSLIAFAACALYAAVTRRAARSFAFCVAVLVFIAGAVYTYCCYFSYCQSEVPLGEFAVICGRVKEVGTSSSGGKYLVLSNVTVGGIPLNGKLVAYLSGDAGDYCGKGYDVTFSSSLAKESFFEFGEINYRAISGVKFSCTVYGGLQATYRFSLFGEILNAIENTLFSNLSPETAGVSFAMLTGNTEGISDGTLASFRQGGIAHVFAVSGLHIGVIYGALTFLFNKIRLNRFVSTAVKIAFVAAYAGVCGFSPSSVRALVCCSVSAFSACVYRKYDGLNALAVAAIILLIINPLYLFGIGFLLSFGAMSGIILLSPNLKRLFGFLPKKLGGVLAVGWSAQISTVPCLMSTFGYVSAAGLLLNIIFIPLVSAVYVIIFVGTLIGAVFPPFAFSVLPYLCTPLELIINLVTFCGFENAVISGSYGYIIYLPFILLTAGLTDKINLRPFIRGALVAFPLLAIVITLSAKTGCAGGGNGVTFNGGYSGGAVTFSTDTGTVLVVTDNYSSRIDYDGDDYDALVVLGGDDNVSVVMSLGCEFKAVYFRGSAIQIPAIGGMPVTYADKFTVCGVDFQFSGNVLLCKFDGVTVAVEREPRGEIYGSLLQNAQFNLYCYGNDSAVLFAPENSYGLRVCGEMRFGIDGSKILPSFAVPAE